jgi:hypothetical protein
LRAFANDDIKLVDHDPRAPQYHDYNVGVDLSYTIRF